MNITRTKTDSAKKQTETEIDANMAATKPAFIGPNLSNRMPQGIPSIIK